MAGGAVELQRFDRVYAHGLTLLNGVDGQDNLAGTQVECALNYLCRQREVFHDARLKRADLAGKQLLATCQNAYAGASTGRCTRK